MSDVRDLLTSVRQIERQWQKQVDVGDQQMFTGWMPSDVAQFLVLLIEAIAEAPGNSFLEVGCGPGTKMMLARDLFGLDVTGFDRVTEYVVAAKEQGLNAAECDAFDFGAYNKFDIVFFNRPFRDRPTQAKLEKHVYSKIRRGAVVICMNLETQPPGDKYLVVTDDWESRRGVWLKL
jgi:trans-aconitate methyltransferase